MSRTNLFSAVFCQLCLVGLLGCGESTPAVPADGAIGGDTGVDSASADRGVADATPSVDLPTSSDGAAPGVVKVWTFNLLRPKNPSSDDSDVEQRTQIVIDAINAEQPDLVALQEVVQSGPVPNRAETIANATGLHWAYEDEYSVVLWEEGIGVLSRWPISETEVVELPHIDMFVSHRKVLRARVQRPGGAIDFYCTHLIAFSLDDATADQALTAYQFISARAGGLPAVFAGDMNAEPQTLPMKFLRGEASHEGVTGDFVDAWLVTRGADPGYTSTSEDPHDRIDYIYVAPSTPPAPAPQMCKLIFDQPVGGTYASDHIGVACDIRF